MGDKIKVEASIKIEKDVVAYFEDDDSTVIEDQARDAIMDVAGLNEWDEFEITEIKYFKFVDHA